MTRKAPITQLPPLFDCVAPADRTELASQSRVVLLKKGQRVWSDGDTVQDLLVVRSGCLGAALRAGPETEESRVVAAYPPDAVVARSLAIPKPAMMDLHALVSSSVLAIPLFALRPVAQRTPELYENFSDAYVQALHWQLFFSSRLAASSLERRLAYVLWSLSRVSRDGRRVIDFRLGQAELAQLAGTDRSELSRRTQLLVKSGMLVKFESSLELTPSFRMLLAHESDAPAFILEGLR